jgi:hypothetical protein
VGFNLTTRGEEVSQVTISASRGIGKKGFAPSGLAGRDGRLNCPSVARTRLLLEKLRQVETNPQNYRLSAGGYLAEIARMNLEVREYLSLHSSELKNQAASARKVGDRNLTEPVHLTTASSSTAARLRDTNGEITDGNCLTFVPH